MERQTAKSLVSVICILSLLSNYLYTTKLLDLSTYFSSYRLDHHLSLALLPKKNTDDATATTTTTTTIRPSATDTATPHLGNNNNNAPPSLSNNDINNMNHDEESHNNSDNSNDSLQCHSSVDGTTTTTTILPQIPSFILVGAQKAGTTALYFLLEQLPDIEPSLAFEAHFFDQREPLLKQQGIQKKRKKKISLSLSLTSQEICQAREHYLQFWDNNGTFPAGYLGFEKTPVYLCKPEIPALMHQVVPWAKIIVMLRNPVDRAYSGYRMMRERVANESEVGSFERVVDQQVKLARDNGQSTAPLLRHYVAAAAAAAAASNYNNNNNETITHPDELFALQDTLRPSMDISYVRLLSRGMYARQIINWLQYFTLDVNIKFIRYEVFAEHPSEVLNDILAFVGAKHPHKLPASVFQNAYRPTRGIKRNYTQPMLPSTREYLERFYEPYNRELVELLGEEWRDVWKNKKKT